MKKRGVVDCVDPQTLSYEQVPDFLMQESNLNRFKGGAASQLKSKANRQDIIGPFPSQEIEGGTYPVPQNTRNRRVGIVNKNIVAGNPPRTSAEHPSDSYG